MVNLYVNYYFRDGCMTTWAVKLIKKKEVAGAWSMSLDVIPVKDFVLAVLEKNKEIGESTKELFRNIDKSKYRQHEYYSQARAFREFVQACSTQTGYSDNKGVEE